MLRAGFLALRVQVESETESVRISSNGTINLVSGALGEDGRGA